jgi:hypothetical protein
MDLSAALAPVQADLARLQQTQEEKAKASAARLQAMETNQAMLLQQQNSTVEHIVKLSDSIQALTIQQQSGQRLLEETRSTVKGLTDAYATAQKAATNLPPAPNPKLSFDPQIKGVTVASEDGHCLIRFDSAFFGRGVHFKVGSKGLLDAIAKSLVQTQEKLNVEIIGYADQEPPFWPWSARVSPAQLALDRAERVKLYLRHLNIFPANALTATNGTPTERSFSTDGISNRTVIIRISGQ